VLKREDLKKVLDEKRDELKDEEKEKLKKEVEKYVARQLARSDFLEEKRSFESYHHSVSDDTVKEAQESAARKIAYKYQRTYNIPVHRNLE
jgi:hypothetical protein